MHEDSYKPVDKIIFIKDKKEIILNGKFNWWSFSFDIFYYIYKGMLIKGLLYVFIIVITFTVIYMIKNYAWLNIIGIFSRLWFGLAFYNDYKKHLLSRGYKIKEIIYK